VRLGLGLTVRYSAVGVGVTSELHVFCVERDIHGALSLATENIEWLALLPQRVELDVEFAPSAVGGDHLKQG